MSTNNCKSLKRPSGAKRSCNTAVPPIPSTTKACKYSAKDLKDSAKALEDSENAPKDAVKEFIIRVPKVRNSRHIMRFNDNLKVDFAEWQSAKMSRENNKHLLMVEEEKKPKFGGGTEYNWRQYGGARRKKNASVVEKYRPEAQPWLLQIDGKTGKKFKGIRTGEVGANAAYYVFTHAPDGRFNAYPLHEWYTFQAIERYKTLTSEEVELEFGRREKSLNFFNLMMRRRYQNDEEEQDGDSAKLLKATDEGISGLKISDEVEWMVSSGESESDDGIEEVKQKEKEKENGIIDATDGKKAKPKGKKEVNMKTFFEAFEDSDDGDEDSRERDYISSSSEDEHDQEAKVIKDLKGVSEEEALRKLLNSDEEDDDENSDNQKDEIQEENPEDGAFSNHMVETPSNLSSGESSIESSADSSDSEKDLSNGPPRKRVTFNEKEKRMYNAAKKSSSKDSTKRIGSTPRSTRNPTISNNASAPRKNIKAPLNPSISLRKINQYGVNEEAVMRYLKRKPLTPTELLSKFRNKATTDSKIRLVGTMTKILKKIDPVKNTIQGKLYFSIK
ncbi:general transcription factor IIF subunit 1-like [Drosophila miranda]|uniref:general transcription factor IIF subunit 1-like n=1 Tax=Drosophila miranda TaxID=7229 RepID=UPI00143F67AC|nr:general transcription factor IIF subunit 1-like [Drosophila miranda]